MFTLTPLAIALQGIGYGTLLTSLQGLLAVTATPEPFDDTGGAQAAVRPRRRVRRWASLAAVPAPWELMQAADRDDEELLALGAL